MPLLEIPHEGNITKKNKFYWKHRDRLLAERRYEYHNNPEFRAKSLEKTKEYNEKKKAERRTLKKLIKDESKIWKQFKVNGRVVECCKIAYLAAKMGRSKDTLKAWEKKGFPPTFRYKTMRYYTREQVDLVLNVWRRYSLKGSISDFLVAINKEWNEYLIKSGMASEKKAN